MKRIISILAGAAFVVSLGLPLGASDTKTVKGEVVDVGCQAKKPVENTGEAHESCAMVCAKKGLKMGILASDGVYEIAGDYAAENNKKLIEFVAKKVEATGDVTEKDGKKVITVSSMKLDK